MTSWDDGHDRARNSWTKSGRRRYGRTISPPRYAPRSARDSERLLALSEKRQVAIMCAEAVPWRCHRSLIADALTVRGVPVEPITSRTQRRPHALTPLARVRGRVITYPPV